MISEQKMIEQMQKRKIRIIALCFVIPLYGVLLGLAIAAYQKATHVISPVLPYTFNIANLEQQLPDLLSTYANLSIAASRMYALGLMAACILGIFIGLLIVEIRGQTYDRLIVSMWKRLEKLEKDVRQSSGGDSSTRADAGLEPPR
ncbi:MAG: hypothetical protein HY343_07905 [Lentisphaerae bacterium]|nr:hypothetical protein [Lentisphaerota bacterium]